MKAKWQKWTVEVLLTDGTVRRVRDIEAVSDAHVRVKVADKLTSAGFVIRRVNWAVPEGEPIPARGRVSGYAVRQCQREAVSRDFLGELG